MATLQEVTDRFSRLAQTLNRIEDDDGNEDKESINHCISKLNTSLNLTEEDSRVTVLESALSLMCFEPPKVFHSVVDYSVKTIASVLSSSISSQVLRFGNDQVLRIGSSIPCHDCEELIQLCVDLVEKLRGHCMLSALLLGAVVRVAVTTSCYQLPLPYTVYPDKRVVDRNGALSELLSYLPRELSLDKQEIPLRLLFWYLDPLILKHDISKILQEYKKRPLLCVSKEFHERVDWRSIVICLTLSPTMFIEIRALLHDWFLLTGLALILEFLTELVSVILDINVSPTLWGISLELGSQLPFSGAYFPHKNHLLRNFAGPLTSEGFLRIVHATSQPTFHTRKQFVPTINFSEAKVATIDHRSLWSLAINFPGWFYFASILLFSENGFQENFHSNCTLRAPNLGQMQDTEGISAAAARYIAWILCPDNTSGQELLSEYLKNIAEAWALKLLGIGQSHKKESRYLKTLKKPRIYKNKEDYALEKDFDCQMIGLWLEEVQSMYMQYSAKTVNKQASFEARRSHGFNLQQSMCFRRIPLGILVGYSNFIKEEGCGFLLHYAATGRITQFRETNRHGLKHGHGKSLSKEYSIMSPLDYSKREAIAGVHLVFSLTDIVESQLASLTETEERASDFICQVKVKTGNYLIKCIKRLIQLCIDGDGVEMLVDLSSRLVQWRHQGQDLVQFDNDIDEIIGVLSQNLSPI